jgi:hypothetical protein
MRARPCRLDGSANQAEMQFKAEMQIKKVNT